MARLNVSLDLKNKILAAISQPESEDGIHSAINKIFQSSDDKIYAARFLDELIKGFNKILADAIIKEEKWRAALQQRLNSNDPLAKIQNSIDAYTHYQGCQLNELSGRLGAGKIYTSPHEIQAQKLEKQRKNIENMLERAKVGRAGIKFNKQEQQLLYPSPETLYQEQVNNRKWYQDGVVVILFSVLLFPLAPLFYYFWKTDREEEMIQPNAKLSLTVEKQNQIIQNRKSFKRSANSRQELFLTNKTETSSTYESIPPAWVTKYKNERDKLFLEDGFFASKENIQKIVQNRSVDYEERLLLGLK